MRYLCSIQLWQLPSAFKRYTNTCYCPLCINWGLIPKPLRSLPLKQYSIGLKKIPTNQQSPHHTCRFRNAFFIQEVRDDFSKLHEASPSLRDPQCDIKLCAREKWVIQTAKKPKVIIKLLPQCKNLYLYKGKLLSLQREGGIKTGSSLLLDL